MNDWQQALAGSPALAHTTKSVELGTAHRWDRPPVPVLPQLSQLLQAGRVTPLVLNGSPHELLAWDLSDGTTTGWVCPQPSPATAVQQVPDVLRDLWRVTGGVVHYWNDLENWMSSHFAVLTAELAATPAAELVADAAWVWESQGLTLPFDPAEYGVLAEEAGGILTLFHRTSGDVLMFAQDHNFDHIEVLDGCLEYTFYRIPAAPDVTAWIETVAGQWLAAVRR